MNSSDENTTRTLDDIDRAIIAELQANARTTSRSISDKIGVSGTTVRNRIERLEAEGVLKGYQPLVEYERTGLERPILFVCTAPIVDRETLATEALSIDGVVSVSEVMEGRSNVYIKAVVPDQDGITEVAKRLDELGFTIESESLLRNEYSQPCSYLQPESSTDHL